jgi:hypothetical protein
MAAEWYYTTNKTQMGPVSWPELRELADVGILKPHDMVWSDGMDEWVKAINQTGLFAEVADSEPLGRKKKSGFAEPPKPPPARRTRRREEEEEDEEEEDDRKKKRRSRQREQERTKTGVGIKVGLILGGMFVGLMFLTCLGGGLIWMLMSGDARPAPKGVVIAPPPVAGQQVAGQQAFNGFTVRQLPPTRWEEKHYNFRQGKRMVITVNTAVIAGRRPDVDLFIHRGNGPGDNLIAQDVSIGPNSRVEFVVPANDLYRVRVGNHGPGVATSCNVTIVELP